MNKRKHHEQHTSAAAAFAIDTTPDPERRNRKRKRERKGKGKKQTKVFDMKNGKHNERTNDEHIFDFAFDSYQKSFIIDDMSFWNDLEKSGISSFTVPRMTSIGGTGSVFLDLLLNHCVLANF